MNVDFVYYLSLFNIFLCLHLNLVHLSKDTAFKEETSVLVLNCKLSFGIVFVEPALAGVWLQIPGSAGKKRGYVVVLIYSRWLLLLN